MLYPTSFPSISRKRHKEFEGVPVCLAGVFTPAFNTGKVQIKELVQTGGKLHGSSCREKVNSR